MAFYAITLKVFTEDTACNQLSYPFVLSLQGISFIYYKAQETCLYYHNSLECAKECQMKKHFLQLLLLPSVIYILLTRKKKLSFKIKLSWKRDVIINPHAEKAWRLFKFATLCLKSINLYQHQLN